MSDTPSAPLADGTDQPVVGSGVDREAYWHERYVELKREFAEIDMQLAAHRYALSLQNKCSGLPEDNEAYNKLPELLAEVRECLIQAADQRDSALRHLCAKPWHECECNDCARWRRAAGLDTANARNQGLAPQGETNAK